MTSLVVGTLVGNEILTSSVRTSTHGIYQSIMDILGSNADNKFKSVIWKQSENGFPILENSLAWFDCIKWNYYSGGDHQILVGEVTSFNSLELEPLTFWNGQIS